MSCQAGPGIEPGPSALKASALPIELTWQVYKGTTRKHNIKFRHIGHTTSQYGQSVFPKPFAEGTLEIGNKLIDTMKEEEMGRGHHID